MLAAKGRPVVLLNPRVPYMPVETDGFETVYQLRQYNVQPVKTNPKVRRRMESVVDDGDCTPEAYHRFRLET